MITVNGQLKDLNKQKITKFMVTKNGSYNVADNSSTTRSNEKKLILLLSEALIEKIINKIKET